MKQWHQWWDGCGAGAVVAFAVMALVVAGMLRCGGSSTALNRVPTVRDSFDTGMEEFEKGHWLIAGEVFRLFTLVHSDVAYVDSANYLWGEAHYNMKEYLLAADAFERLLRDYPRSDLADDAQYKLGMSHYRKSPRFQLSQEETFTAIAEFQVLIEDFPETDRKAEAEEKIFELRNKLARKDFEAGRQYLKLGYPRAAVQFFSTMLNIYWDSRWVPDALYYKAVAHAKREEYQDAIMELQQFLERFDRHELVPKATALLADVEARLPETTALQEGAVPSP